MIDGIKLVRPDDVEAHTRLAAQVGGVWQFWPDANRVSPVAWYASQFCNYNNLILDIADGNGVAAFLYTQPGWRSQLWGAAWGKPAMRRLDLFKTAGSIAAETLDLLVIDAFVMPLNRLARRAVELAGMRQRGVISDALQYNGVESPVLWYEITREELGLVR